MTRLRQVAAARRRLVVGNWKMNGDASLLARSLVAAGAAAGKDGSIVGLAVPHTLISAGRIDGVAIGAQDVHEEVAGAHTGGVSASMVHEAGATFTILGHSERRLRCGEDDRAICRKMERAQKAGLDVLLCCGEPASVRATGDTLAHVCRQLRAALELADPTTLVVAYEPCWAVGTGHVPTFEEIIVVTSGIGAMLRDRFGERGDEVPVLYGGSVDVTLSRSIASATSLGGVLVGKASLDLSAFCAIVEEFSAPRSRQLS